MYAIPSKDGMRNQASPPSSAASRMVGDGDPDVAREEALVAALRAILRSSPRFLEMLAAVRSCDPPDWMVGGGVLRDIVWDHLHCYPAPAHRREEHPPALAASPRDRRLTLPAAALQRSMHRPQGYSAAPSTASAAPAAATLAASPLFGPAS